MSIYGKSQYCDKSGQAFLSLVIILAYATNMENLIKTIKNFFKYILVDYWADREAAKGQKDNQAVTTAGIARI